MRNLKEILSEEPSLRMNKDEALNDALKLQKELYRSSSPHLRNNKSFPIEEYTGTDELIDHLKKVQTEIKLMPTAQPQRAEYILDLIEKYSLNFVVGAWHRLIHDQYPRTKELQKFMDYSAPLFRGSDSNYHLLDTARYNYGSASNYYAVLAHQLYKQISNKPYLSPQELQYNFQAGVQGKRILEFAPGPGWFMKVLKDAGADVVGLEKSVEHGYVANAWGLEIKQGDAAKLDESFDEKFDMIISNNFLNEVTVGREVALKILAQTKEKLKPNGLGLHSTQLFETPIEQEVLQQVASSKKEDAYDIRGIVMDKDFQNHIAASDIPSMRGSDLIDMGFKNVREGHEAGYYYVSYSN